MSSTSAIPGRNGGWFMMIRGSGFTTLPYYGCLFRGYHPHLIPHSVNECILFHQIISYWSCTDTNKLRLLDGDIHMFVFLTHMPLLVDPPQLYTDIILVRTRLLQFPLLTGVQPHLQKCFGKAPKHLCWTPKNRPIVVFSWKKGASYPIHHQSNHPRVRSTRPGAASRFGSALALGRPLGPPWGRTQSVKGKTPLDQATDGCNHRKTKGNDGWMGFDETNHTTSLVSWTLESLCIQGKSFPFMAELFRLVNYYNLPSSRVV